MFVAQFLGALNDNLLKNALVIQVAYGRSESASDVEVIVTIATALFILPYFLFSATAGELADKFAKMQLIRVAEALGDRRDDSSPPPASSSAAASASGSRSSSCSACKRRSSAR